MSQTISLTILAITSLICSRVMFLFFNDPEGPNLLVVVGMAFIIFIPSLFVLLFSSVSSYTKKLLFSIFVEIVVTICIYFLL